MADSPTATASPENVMARPAVAGSRLRRILAPIGPIPVSKSTWWAGIRDGRFPKGVKIGRITAWRVEDIRELIAQLGGDLRGRRR